MPGRVYNTYEEETQWKSTQGLRVRIPRPRGFMLRGNEKA